MDDFSREYLNYKFDKRAFGRRIRKVRADRGMTQMQVALLSGLTPTRVCGYEAGAHEPLAGQLYRLSMALGVTERWLLTGEKA